jgi:hypothetical protein
VSRQVFLRLSALWRQNFGRCWPQRDPGVNNQGVQLKGCLKMKAKIITITVAAIAALVLLPPSIGFVIGGLLAGAYTAKLSNWNPAIMTGSAVGAWMFLGHYFTIALLTGYLLSNMIHQFVDNIADKISQAKQS